MDPRNLVVSPSRFPWFSRALPNTHTKKVRGRTTLGSVARRSPWPLKSFLLVCSPTARIVLANYWQVVPRVNSARGAGTNKEL